MLSNVTSCPKCPTGSQGLSCGLLLGPRLCHLGQRSFIPDASCAQRRAPFPVLSPGDRLFLLASARPRLPGPWLHLDSHQGPSLDSRWCLGGVSGSQAVPGPRATSTCAFHSSCRWTVRSSWPREPLSVLQELARTPLVNLVRKMGMARGVVCSGGWAREWGTR